MTISGIFGANPALAFPINTDDPGVIARTHCRLILKAAGDPRPLLRDVLDDVLSTPGYAMKQGNDTAIRIWEVTGGLPDMGFVIGQRMDVATAAERKNINHFFTQLLVKRFGIQNPVALGSATSYSDTCPVKVTTRLKGESEWDDSATQMNKQLFPRPKAYVAMVQTALPTGTDTAAHLTYMLEKSGSLNWEITELSVDTLPLTEHYSDQLNRIIAQEGFDGLNRWLTQRIQCEGKC